MKPYNSAKTEFRHRSYLGNISNLFRTASSIEYGQLKFLSIFAEKRATCTEICSVSFQPTLRKSLPIELFFFNVQKDLSAILTLSCITPQNGQALSKNLPANAGNIAE